ncbi:HEPN domain-containing protein [Gaoshiqia sediminis]|uniref:HEPN domain-containing protein n=1 Tax=Gaoshiqia sediminis TaxID=2986998 RepID=A0AA42CBA1_9BACT|nr:HEPN domain-containing protein [Gaoshiqia sediminis]MCW0484967.1 HEPN domain-containing protein [Gaoshiqia sediminis]
MKQITKDWLEAASIDIESIEALIKNTRLTGHVAFHAQQAIEKALKAIMEENGERVPKVHSLSKLFDSCSIYIDFEFDEDLIIALDSLYIESRYPGEFGLLPQGKPSLQQAQRFYDFAKDVYQTVINHLEKD